MNNEEKKEYNKRYRLTNREKRKEYNKKWHLQNRTSQLQKMKDRYQKVKNEPHTKEIAIKAKQAAKERSTNYSYEMKIGNPCSNCGLICNNPTTHDWHHKESKDKRLAVSSMVSQGYSVVEIEKEIKKCILLCRNCHALTYKTKY